MFNFESNVDDIFQSRCVRLSKLVLFFFNYSPGLAIAIVDPTVRKKTRPAIPFHSQIPRGFSPIRPTWPICTPPTSPREVLDETGDGGTGDGGENSGESWDASFMGRTPPDVFGGDQTESSLPRWSPPDADYDELACIQSFLAGEGNSPNKERKSASKPQLKRIK